MVVTDCGEASSVSSIGFNLISFLTSGGVLLPCVSFVRSTAGFMSSHMLSSQDSRIDNRFINSVQTRSLSLQRFDHTMQGRRAAVMERDIGSETSQQHELIKYPTLIHGTCEH